MPRSEYPEPTEGKSRPPLPRYQRVTTALPGLVLQERDLALLEDVWRYGLLTTSQLEALRSGDAESKRRFVSRLTLTRRLKLLFHHRYLKRIARPLSKGSLEPVYLLDLEGAKALRRRHGEVTARAPSQQPKAAALEHLLAINQVRVSVAVACSLERMRHENTSKESATSQCAELLSWQGSRAVQFSVALPQPGERTKSVTLLPDGFFCLRSGGQRLFYFVEVDLGTEPGKTLEGKCRAYYAYWQSGGFARDFSVPKQVGFRVLFIAPTAKRLETVCQAIRSLPAGRGMFWTALEESVTPQQILEPVFQDSLAGALQRLTGTP